MAQVNSGDDAALGKLVRLGVWLILAAWSIVVLGVGGAYQLGAYLTNVEAEVKGLREDVGEIKQSLTADYQVRLRNLERQIAAGILPEAKARDAEFELRLQRLEQRRSDRD